MKKLSVHISCDNKHWHREFEMPDTSKEFDYGDLCNRFNDIILAVDNGLRDYIYNHERDRFLNVFQTDRDSRVFKDYFKRKVYEKPKRA